MAASSSARKEGAETKLHINSGENTVFAMDGASNGLPQTCAVDGGAILEISNDEDAEALKTGHSPTILSTLKSCLHQGTIARGPRNVSFASQLVDYFEFAVSLTPSQSSTPPLEITDTIGSDDENEAECDDATFVIKWKISSSLENSSCRKIQTSADTFGSSAQCDEIQHVPEPFQLKETSENDLLEENTEDKTLAESNDAQNQIDILGTSRISTIKEDEVPYLEERVLNYCTAPVIPGLSEQCNEAKSNPHLTRDEKEEMPHPPQHDISAPGGTESTIDVVSSFLSEFILQVMTSLVSPVAEPTEVRENEKSCLDVEGCEEMPTMQIDNTENIPCSQRVNDEKEALNIEDNSQECLFFSLDEMKESDTSSPPAMNQVEQSCSNVVIMNIPVPQEEFGEFNIPKDKVSNASTKEMNPENTNIHVHGDMTTVTNTESAGNVSTMEEICTVKKASQNEKQEVLEGLEEDLAPKPINVPCCDTSIILSSVASDENCENQKDEMDLSPEIMKYPQGKKHTGMENAKPHEGLGALLSSSEAEALVHNVEKVDKEREEENDSPAVNEPKSQEAAQNEEKNIIGAKGNEMTVSALVPELATKGQEEDKFIMDRDVRKDTFPVDEPDVPMEKTISSEENNLSCTLQNEQVSNVQDAHHEPCSLAELCMREISFSDTKLHEIAALISAAVISGDVPVYPSLKAPEMLANGTSAREEYPTTHKYETLRKVSSSDDDNSCLRQEEYKQDFGMLDHVVPKAQESADSKEGEVLEKDKGPECEVILESHTKGQFQPMIPLPSVEEREDVITESPTRGQSDSTPLLVSDEEKEGTYQEQFNPCDMTKRPSQESGQENKEMSLGKPGKKIFKGDYDTSSCHEEGLEELSQKLDLSLEHLSLEDKQCLPEEKSTSENSYCGSPEALFETMPSPKEDPESSRAVPLWDQEDEEPSPEKALSDKSPVKILKRRLSSDSEQACQEVPEKIMKAEESIVQQIEVNSRVPKRPRDDGNLTGTTDDASGSTRAEKCVRFHGNLGSYEAGASWRERGEDQAVPREEEEQEEEVKAASGETGLDSHLVDEDSLSLYDDEAKKGDMPSKREGSYKWSYAPSVDFDSVAVMKTAVDDTEPAFTVQPLFSSKRPLRIGLSKRQKFRPLHPNYHPKP